MRHLVFFLCHLWFLPLAQKNETNHNELYGKRRMVTKGGKKTDNEEMLGQILTLEE